MSVYALNLFTIANRREYLAYLARSGDAVERHNGRVHAIGKYLESKAGDVKPRQVMIVVEWASREDLERYLADPALQDLHPHREKGTTDYVWQLFEKQEDFRGILRSARG